MFFTITIIAFLVAIFTPNRRDLVESYLIIEGKQLATGENAEKAVEKVSSQIDKLIDSIGNETKTAKVVIDSAREIIKKEEGVKK